MMKAALNSSTIVRRGHGRLHDRGADHGMSQQCSNEQEPAYVFRPITASGMVTHSAIEGAPAAH